MFDKKSEYALNKYDQDSIIYICDGLGGEPGPVSQIHTKPNRLRAARLSSFFFRRTAPEQPGAPASGEKRWKMALRPAMHTKASCAIYTDRIAACAGT